MMGHLGRLAACMALMPAALAQLPSDKTEGLTFLSGTKTVQATETMPSGPYQSFTTTSTLASTAMTPLVSGDANETDSGSSTSQTITFLTGSARPTGNSSTTSSGPVPTNTTPCNNYPEFCSRKYSNITMVSCHNSPFTRPKNAASNQEFDVVEQLNDGVRFLQGQIQWPANATVPHFCHTSCDIMDAGPITDWLTRVKNWVAKHPYDVVTILLGNGNYSTPDLYAPHIQSTGILKYVYTPPVQPMALDDWPILGDMILSGQRVVMFLDYMANQKDYPWLLDQFSQMWETPFDPVDRKFPCDPQRPPNLSPDDARKRLSLMNHNLNVEVAVLGSSILVPDTSNLNATNNVTGFGSLGAAANTCRTDWDKPPNFLNVDYYNYGGFPGSVFEVAAEMNNVTYKRGTCCGKSTSDASSRTGYASSLVLMGSSWLLLWLFA